VEVRRTARRSKARLLRRNFTFGQRAFSLLPQQRTLSNLVHPHMFL
jgi:hypothetical protein